MDHLITEGIAQAFDADREIPSKRFGNVDQFLVNRVLLGDGLLGRHVVCGHHPHPTLVKNTAKNASSTITMKIAMTTAEVVRRPTSSAFPSTCSPW